ncbi:hypothetical protein CG428_21590 [Pantoea ananatis]|uniref:hypothetical protein n=1 Tax=Pantoea ananas TaxID=553 RepID=UPI000CF3A85E|nr:hypothetical protein [Pantoea ananatis]PQK69532.1 hypothetical protein CG428_21590 [Pantoea ananatis]
MNKAEFNKYLSEVSGLASNAFNTAFAQAYPEKGSPGISFALCTKENAIAADSWPDTSKLKDGYGNWSWEKIFFSSRYRSERFVVSVSRRGVIGGMFSGRLADNSVELQFVQRNASDSGIKGFVIPASITFSAVLGAVMNSEYVSVSEPAPGLIDKYEEAMKGSVAVQYKDKDVVEKMTVRVDEVLAPSTPETD